MSDGKAFIRDSSNVRGYVEMQIMVAKKDVADPKINKDGTFGTDWEGLGCLKEGQKLELERQVEVAKTKGLGVGVVATVGKAGEVTAKAVCLEDNETTRWVAWPDSVTPTDGKGTTDPRIVKHSGILAETYIALVFDRTDGKREIWASRAKASLAMSNLSRQAGGELDGQEVEISFMNDDKGAMFDTWVTDVPSAEAEKLALIRVADGD